MKQEVYEVVQTKIGPLGDFLGEILIFHQCFSVLQNTDAITGNTHSKTVFRCYSNVPESLEEKMLTNGGTMPKIK